MARKSARSVINDDDDFEDPAPPASPGPNCTDATKRKAYQEALVLKIAVESAAEVARGKLGAYRAYLKEAKKRGVDTKAIASALAVRFQDPDLVLIEKREELRMLDLSGFLPGIREKLLGRFDVQEATNDEEEENQVLIAFDRGTKAGRSGHPRSTNPYPEGSLGERKWNDGWRGGQMAIADEMIPGITSDTAPRQPKASPAKASAKPSTGKAPRAKKATAAQPHAEHSQGDLPVAIPAAVH